MGRRAFLQGVGGVTLSLPFLSSLVGGTARAQEKRPTRVVIVFHSHGTLKSRWKPSATGALGTLPALLSPLEPHKAKLNVLSGIDNIVNYMNRNTNGHNGAARTLLTCQPFQGVKQGQQPDNAAADGPSIDWVLGPKLKGSAPRAVINLGITDSDLGENTIFWRDAGQAATLLTNPKAAADALFANLTPPPGASGTPAPKTPAELFRSRRGSVLDAVAQSYKRLSQRMPAEDRARLDAHMEQVRNLENLASGAGAAASCGKPVLGLPSGYSPGDRSREDASAAAQIENTVMALACNLAPVVTLQFVEYQNPNFQFLFDGDEQAVLRGGDQSYNDWHAMVHEAPPGNDSTGVGNLTKGFSWYMQQVANLWQRLNEVEDGPGQTLAQNTLLLAISEFGDGAHHITTELPVALLGDLNGKLRSGQHLDMTGYTTGDLYTTLQSITTGDSTEFGMTGALSGAGQDNGRAFHKGLLPGLSA